MEVVRGDKRQFIPGTGGLGGVIRIHQYPIHDQFRAEIPIDQAEIFLSNLGVIAQGIGAVKLRLDKPHEGNINRKKGQTVFTGGVL